MTLIRPFLVNRPSIAKGIFDCSLVFILCVLWLSGCQHAIKDPPFEKKSYELERQQTTYTLHIDPRNFKINTQDIYELHSLLNPESIGKVSVHATLPLARNKGEDKKIVAIKNALIKQGMKETRIHIKPIPLAITSHSVEIALDTYRAIPPVCGDWHFPMGEARGAMIYPNYGCADARNFILMLEDPIVLWQGAKDSGHDTNRDIKFLRDFQSGMSLKLSEDTSDNQLQDQNYGQDSSNNG